MALLAGNLQANSLPEIGRGCRRRIGSTRILRYPARGKTCGVKLPERGTAAPTVILSMLP